MQPKPAPPRINTDFATFSHNSSDGINGRSDLSAPSPLEKAVDYINHQFSNPGASNKAQQPANGNGTGPLTSAISIAGSGNEKGNVTGGAFGAGSGNFSHNPLVVEVERAAGNCGYGWDSTGQKVWLGYRSDVADGSGSPPSPSTIETSTDSYGGEHAPPSSGTYSSIGGDDPNQSDFYNHHVNHDQQHPLLRARSVSQPSSFSNRKQAFHLNIPQQSSQHGFSYAQPETVSPAMLNGAGSGEAQYVMMASGHVVSVSPSAMAENDYFAVEDGGLPTGVGSATSYGMDVDLSTANTTGNGTSQMAQQTGAAVEAYMSSNGHETADQTNNYHRYGYRLPASQPSSPVRSGYPPGMAPYAAAPNHAGTRPRGATVSGLTGQPGYHDLARLRMVSTPNQNGNGSPVNGTLHSQMNAHQISHQHHNSSPFQYNPTDSPGGLSNASYSTTTGPSVGDHASPFQNVNSQSAAPSAPSTPAPPAGQSIDAFAGTPSRLAFSNMSMMTSGQGDHLMVNTVPLLETQAQAAAAYGLGMSDVSMEQTGMGLTDVQANYMQAMAGMSTGSIGPEDFIMDSMMSRSQPSVDSRRSSASGVFNSGLQMSSSFSSILPMTDFNSAHSGIGGNMTPDLSSHVQDKLSFLDGLANSVAQARAEILRGDGHAADDHISSVGNAILEQALAPATQSATGTIQPGMHLTLPVLDDLVAQAVPAVNVTDSSATLAPPQSAAPATALAPAIQLKRSNSQKRSAPESPRMSEAAKSTNKHMRLDDVSMDATEQPLPAVNKVLPPPMTHSHSFPNGHLLPSQTSNPPAAVLGNNSPITASPAFPSQLAPVFSIPHVPSPLSAFPMTAQDPSTLPFPYSSMTANPALLQGSGVIWQNHPAMQATTTSYPGTPLETVPETGVFVPVQQMGITTRRGSIVDGRLIAGRPSNTLSQVAAGDNRSASTSAMPSKTALNQVKRSGSPDPDGMDDDGDSDSGGEEGGADKGGRRHSGEGGPSVPGALVQPPDLVSDEVRAQLDIILLNFLNIVCSDLEFHDAKGELLHQALMPKKMAKLDESPDFRPFKFRIQAFTNAFQEELQRLGVLEEALSAKKIKSYLWTQNRISRYNDDGKKAKSKGNHIWMVNAKKLPSGAWVFKEFQRRMLPVPSAQAFVGMLYSWAPRVWDPQASTTGLKVEYSSPEGSLPDWLSWKGPVLSGTPRVGGFTVPISVVASFKDSNNKQHQLFLDFVIRVSNPSGGSTAPSAPLPTPAGLLSSEALMLSSAPAGMDLRNVTASPFIDPNVQHMYAMQPGAHPEQSTTPTQAFHPSSFHLHPSAYMSGSPIPLSTSVSPQPPPLDGSGQNYGARMPPGSVPVLSSLSPAEYEQMQQGAYMNIPR